MYLQITNKCNMRCAHCCNSCGPRGKHAKTETMIDAMKLGQETGEYYTIGGGEPTLHPDFLTILIHGIALQEDMGPHVITNGTNKNISLLLAKLAKKEVIGAELSWDDWHDSSMVDNKVFEAFEKMKALRDIKRPIPIGRAAKTGVGEEYRKYECVCDDILIDIKGRIWACGCKKEQFGTVKNPKIPNEYYERDNKCSNYEKRKKYEQKYPEVTKRWWL